MNAAEKRAGPARAAEPDSGATFDRPHLSRYTIDNVELEREIISLFTQQLPNVLEKLRSAATLAEWKLATHTLKGSAAAVGAKAIHEAALALEDCKIDLDAKVKKSFLDELASRIAAFHRVVTQIYGPL